MVGLIRIGQWVGALASGQAVPRLAPVSPLPAVTRPVPLPTGPNVPGRPVLPGLDPISLLNEVFLLRGAPRREDLPPGWFEEEDLRPLCAEGLRWVGAALWGDRVGRSTGRIAGQMARVGASLSTVSQRNPAIVERFNAKENAWTAQVRTAQTGERQARPLEWIDPATRRAIDALAERLRESGLTLAETVTADVEKLRDDLADPLWAAAWRKAATTLVEARAKPERDAFGNLLPKGDEIASGNALHDYESRSRERRDRAQPSVQRPPIVNAAPRNDGDSPAAMGTDGTPTSAPTDGGDDVTATTEPAPSNAARRSVIGRKPAQHVKSLGKGLRRLKVVPLFDLDLHGRVLIEILEAAGQIVNAIERGSAGLLSAQLNPLRGLFYSAPQALRAVLRDDYTDACWTIFKTEVLLTEVYRDLHALVRLVWPRRRLFKRLPTTTPQRYGMQSVIGNLQGARRSIQSHINDWNWGPQWVLIREKIDQLIVRLEDGERFPQPLVPRIVAELGRFPAGGPSKVDAYELLASLHRLFDFLRDHGAAIQPIDSQEGRTSRKKGHRSDVAIEPLVRSSTPPSSSRLRRRGISPDGICATLIAIHPSRPGPSPAVGPALSRREG